LERGGWSVVGRGLAPCWLIYLNRVIETLRLNRLRWFGHVQRMEENRILKRVLYM